MDRARKKATAGSYFVAGADAGVVVGEDKRSLGSLGFSNGQGERAGWIVALSLSSPDGQLDVKGCRQREEEYFVRHNKELWCG